MKKLIRAGQAVARRHSVALCSGAALALATAPAWATDPAPAVDYAAMMNGGKTELTTALTSIGPAAFGIMAILTAVFLAWKMFKRGAKSS